MSIFERKVKCYVLDSFVSRDVSRCLDQIRYLAYISIYFLLSIESHFTTNDIYSNEINIIFVRGQSPADAEGNYLRIASTLDMYGVELHKTTVKVKKKHFLIKRKYLF